MKAKDVRKATGDKVHRTMHEFKVGELHSWGGPKKPKGKLVTDRRQAIAIALSQARRVEAKLLRKKGK
jgi:hypothetical protein